MRKKGKKSDRCLKKQDCLQRQKEKREKTAEVSDSKKYSTNGWRDLCSDKDKASQPVEKRIPKLLTELIKGSLS
jgi:hypothetical protein